MKTDLPLEATLGSESGVVTSGALLLVSGGGGGSWGLLLFVRHTCEEERKKNDQGILLSGTKTTPLPSAAICVNWFLGWLWRHLYRFHITRLITKNYNFSQTTVKRKWCLGSAKVGMRGRKETCVACHKSFKFMLFL